jgi:hypothetical protein
MAGRADTLHGTSLHYHKSRNGSSRILASRATLNSIAPMAFPLRRYMHARSPRIGALVSAYKIGTFCTRGEHENRVWLRKTSSGLRCMLLHKDTSPNGHSRAHSIVRAMRKSQRYRWPARARVRRGCNLQDLSQISRNRPKVSACYQSCLAGTHLGLSGDLKSNSFREK